MKKLFIFLLTAVMLCMSMTAMAAKKEYNPYVKYVVEDDDYQETLATINSVKMFSTARSAQPSSRVKRRCARS